MNVCQWCGAKPGEPCVYMSTGVIRRRAHPGRYERTDLTAKPPTSAAMWLEPEVETTPVERVRRRLTDANDFIGADE